MQTIGPGQYEAPVISGTAVRFEGSEFAKAEVQNPGGPIQYYHFRAAREGEATLKIPHSAENATFIVTLRVQKRK